MFKEDFLEILGVIRQPGNEYAVIMQHAKHGDLWSYLGQNLNRMTWKRKLELVLEIAYSLQLVHGPGLVHRNLHGGNILFDDDQKPDPKPKAFVSDLGLARSEEYESNSCIKGVLPFIAPEVFHTRKFTKKSDIYALGIIMYLIASGEPPFRNRSFDNSLVTEILDGLRPEMPDSAPMAYKELAAKCCDADPSKRPKLQSLLFSIHVIINQSDKLIWKMIYDSDVKPLTRLEKENKYSSKQLPIVDLGTVSIAGMKEQL